MALEQRPRIVSGTTPNRPRPTLPSLTADDFADLSARRRNATRSLQEALARAEAQRGRIDASTTFKTGQAKSGFEQARQQMLARLGDRGLAFQPRFAGKGLRDLRNQEAAAIGAIGLERADQMQGLQEAVQSARTARDNEVSLIEADKTRRRASLERLLNNIGA